MTHNRNVAKQRHIKRPSIDPYVRSIQESAWLLVHQYLSLLPYLIKTGAIGAVDTIYNIYLFFLCPPADEQGLLRELISEGKMEDGIAIVTGATSGIGKETALGLLEAGYHVHLPVRNMQKGERTLAEFREKVPEGKITLYHCDLCSFADIRRFLSEFRHNCDTLDILINNAGAVWNDFATNEAGVERTMAVHTVAPFMLTTALKDLLEKGRKKRVVNISSSLVYAANHIETDQFTSKDCFSLASAYAHGKYAQCLLMLQLARDWKATGITINMVHPGAVDTNITNEGLPAWLAFLFKWIFGVFFSFARMKPHYSALCVIWASLSQDLDGQTGKYFSDFCEYELPTSLEKDFVLGEAMPLLSYTNHLSNL